MNLPSLWIACVLACLLAVRQLLRLARMAVKTVVPRQRLTFDDAPGQCDPDQHTQTFRLGSLSLSDSRAESGTVRR